MKIRRLKPDKLVRYLLIFALVMGLAPVTSGSSATQAVEVVVEVPGLDPTFTSCSETYWYDFVNNRGYPTYLTLNVYDPVDSTNLGKWQPLIPQSGYYRVEAYIAAHSPIIWCTGQHPTIDHDTTDARYSIHHAIGVTTRSVSQYPLSNQWLDLGEYFFNAGQSGYVYLTDLNSEAEFSTTVSFSAMRFTFTRLTRPNYYLPLVNDTYTSGLPPLDVGVIQAQGFDACHLPEISEMQTWWNQSPYSFYALYIGGIHLPSFCSIANATWVSAVHQQGWSFVPTWVGPQAPCTDYHYRMSSDPAVSYQEGRQEAQSASTAAAAIGLTNNGVGGTIIYYDLEAYGVSTAACRQPVSAFINGWVERLHELGNLAGGYGTRNSFVTDWATIPNGPDSIWPASWYTGSYDPNASVFGITWLEGLWMNHQRIRQYSSPHTESWGGKSNNIDSDVADGIVAMPPSNLLFHPRIFTSPSIEDTGWVSADDGWIVLENHLYWTDDRGKDWRDISPSSVQLAYALPSGQTWALSASDPEQVVLFSSSNRGVDWDKLALELPSGTWQPLQLQFTSPTSGWAVLRKVTSQAFDFGLLIRTMDRGITWKSFDLPSASAIEFTSTSEGWMLSRSRDVLYHTMDGGLSWQSALPENHSLSQPDLPEGSVLSGWLGADLGWSTTATGSCTGEKSTLSFSCQVETYLWQTLDGGQHWQSIPLPPPAPRKP